MGLGDMVIIGDFCFCEEHGSEVCHKCCCDYRMMNNFRIEKKLSAAFPEQTEDDLMDRPPLTDAYSFGAVKSKFRDPQDPDETVYECKQHTVADCDDCFNWGKLVVAKMKFASKHQDAIEIEASREDKLGFLSAMGVGLSPNTRLPEASVDRKLRAALDASQTFTKVVEKTPFNPSSLPIWSSNHPKSVYESVRRSNPAEAMKNMQARAFGENAFPLYQNAFLDVRQTIMTLAKNFDEGHRIAILQDKDSEYAICVRVVNVFRIKDDVPVLILLYGRGTRATPINTTIEWVQNVVSSRQPMPQITATPQEQTLLLTLLAINSKRLSSDYKPKRTRYEKSFKVSFLIPVGPLSQQDVGKLTNTSGCAVCGKKTASKCSGCLSAEYCGEDCQKADWKEHKALCKSLKGGTWLTTTISKEPEEARAAAAKGEKFHMAYVNYSSIMDPNNLDLEAAAGPPPNVHGDKPFLIKIQKAAGLKAGSMLIYDRQRSMQVHLLRSDDPVAYRKAEEAMSTGYMGLKIYRWAKRVGDLQLSICFDRAPPKDPAW